MAGSRHRSQDGAWIEIEASGDVSRPLTNTVVLGVAGRFIEVTAGPLSSGRAAVEAVGPVLEQQTYRYQNGDLHVGTLATTNAAPSGSSPLRVRGGLWEGRWSSVRAFSFSPVIDFVHVFSCLDIVDTPLGATVTPKPGAGVAVHVEKTSALKEVPPVGVLEIAPLTRARARSLPRWRGTAVRGGELFRGFKRAPYFVLVGATAYTVIMPDSDEHGSCDPDGVDRLSTLCVDWVPTS